MPGLAYTSAHTLPPDDIDLIGTLSEVRPLANDTLVELARRHRMGQAELLWANPDVERWNPAEGHALTLPTRYILPGDSRRGLVINLPERRLYYFHDPGGSELPFVVTYPVSIGRRDWNTPSGTTVVVRKKANPDWFPPISIKQEAIAAGRFLPDKVPAGPNNPLGLFALYLGLPGYLIHGTNNTLGIGLRVTHGCLRLYPDDVESLFHLAGPGTEVTIVDEAVKIGRFAGQLFVEVHPPLAEHYLSDAQLLDDTFKRIRQDPASQRYRITYSELRQAISNKSGLPVVIGQLRGSVSTP